MKVLVVNAGSSSLKFTVFSMTKEKMLAKGQVERLGSEDPNLIYKNNEGGELDNSVSVSDHKQALKIVCEKLLDEKI